MRPRLGQRQQSLGRADDVLGQQRVVHGLHGIAGADGATGHDARAEGLEHGPHAFKGRGIATDHHGELALLRPDDAAGHRSVEEPNASLSEPRCDAAGGGRVAGGAVHEHGATRESCEQAIGTVE